MQKHLHDSPRKFVNVKQNIMIKMVGAEICTLWCMATVQYKFGEQYTKT